MRAQRTELDELYATFDLEDSELRDRLGEWQHYYNWERVHGAIGMAPIDRFFALKDKTPFWDWMEPLSWDGDKETCAGGRGYWHRSTAGGGICE